MKGEGTGKRERQREKGAIGGSPLKKWSEVRSLPPQNPLDLDLLSLSSSPKKKKRSEPLFYKDKNAYSLSLSLSLSHTHTHTHTHFPLPLRGEAPKFRKGKEKSCRKNSSVPFFFAVFFSLSQKR